ncbi:ZZ zinc finger domain-containing protein [Phytophthora infestans]|uniref:ZZ zinc finger domain-containing protein n=1 Tax=Phytophthora infestans TaxID=4787 RepID=A0A833SIB9_PHYIN|nr:ZZ zinc finger domain-containing protein [Phytophthora infestans]KAF4133852.1 ZZ zinc finger domain-containing protein [Phytophthora infestans]
MEASATAASPVKLHAESTRATEEPTAAAISPSTPTENDVVEVETEKSPAAAQLELKPHEDGAESDKARTDSDDEDEEPPLKQQQDVVAPAQEPTTPVDAPKTPAEEPTTPTGTHSEPTTPVETYSEPTTPVDQPPEHTFGEDVKEKELIVQDAVSDSPPSPSSSTVGIEQVEKLQVQVHEVELKVQDDEVCGHEVELVIPSPKRPSPLNLVHHDIDDEASDSDDQEGAAGGEDDDEGADLGTPLGYGGAADFSEGQDEFTSHRFLGPSVASDPSSLRALHSLRRVSLHNKPPRFVSEATVAVASSGSVTSSGESSGRNSSSASAIHAPDLKSGLRSQSEVDFVEHPLNTYTLTFTEPVLGFNTNVVVSLENELLVEVESVEKESPAQRGGVVVGDYLISVNSQHIEPHMTKEQVLEIIQTSTVPRTLVFQRDVHDKEGAQSKSLPDKKHSPGKPLMGRLGAAMSQGASIIGSKWKRKKTIVHQNSFCDGCGMDPVVGALWTCSVCSNYNLCNECYDLGTHGMENTEQMQALSEAIVQYKLQKKCKHFTQEFLLSLRRDICKGRPDKFEYLGEWIANIVVGTAAAKITVRGIEIPSLPPTARQRFVSYLMPLVSNRTDIEVNIEWLPDEADQINAACRASVDRMSAGAFGSGDEEEHDGPIENLEKLRIWISDKKTRTTSPFA